MLPVLAIFIDGLRPDSLVHMPFLNSLPHQRRLRTEVGYSITCHATMYTGVHPDKHLVWFAWQYAPERSPFRWTRLLLPLHPIDNVYLRYACSKATRLFHDNSSFTGLPFMVNAPLAHWHLFDVAESKMWDAPGYLPNFPTIFEILRSHSVPATVLGFAGAQSGRLDLIPTGVGVTAATFTYVFIGDVDNYSHKYGQGSPVTIQKLVAIDNRIQMLYEAIQSKLGQLAVLCWSDHGHAPVIQRFDLYQWFAKHGYDLRHHVHLIDTNFARFWFRSTREADRFAQILGDIEGGRILTPAFLAQHRCLMPDNRYGDLILHLAAPKTFAKTIWGYGKRTVSSHGFLPSMQDMDGVFATNLPLKPSRSPVSLVDVLPSILSLLGLPIPAHVDGSVVWED